MLGLFLLTVFFNQMSLGDISLYLVTTDWREKNDLHHLFAAAQSSREQHTTEISEQPLAFCQHLLRIRNIIARYYHLLFLNTAFQCETESFNFPSRIQDVKYVNMFPSFSISLCHYTQIGVSLTTIWLTMQKVTFLKGLEVRTSLKYSSSLTPSNLPPSSLLTKPFFRNQPLPFIPPGHHLKTSLHLDVPHQLQLVEVQEEPINHNSLLGTYPSARLHCMLLG